MAGPGLKLAAKGGDCLDKRITAGLKNGDMSQVDAFIRSTVHALTSSGDDWRDKLRAQEAFLKEERPLGKQPLVLIGRQKQLVLAFRYL